jgi:CBS-domain-containing membrane protein
MLREDIGDVIVFDEDRLYGILTDRDIVVRVVAERRDPSQTRVGDVCSRQLTTVGPDDSVGQALHLMREKAIRRLPVVEATEVVGILTMLFITGTTLNIPSLMGAIMAVGVASANSILLVTFAREQQLAGKTAFESAIEAGHTRIRPVLMTAAAMIVGMIPMAIGGAGEEQNAALARAVIGGLLFATPTTLLVVPYLFAMLRKRNDGKTAQGVFSEDIR